MRTGKNGAKMELNGSQLDVFISIKPNIRNHDFCSAEFTDLHTQVLGCIPIFSIRCFLLVWKLCRWEDLRYKRKPGRESRTIEWRKNKQNGKEGSLTNRMGTSSTSPSGSSIASGGSSSAGSSPSTATAAHGVGREDSGEVRRETQEGREV